jgi:hypothetical protein
MRYWQLPLTVAAMARSSHLPTLDGLTHFVRAAKDSLPWFPPTQPRDARSFMRKLPT